MGLFNKNTNKQLLQKFRLRVKTELEDLTVVLQWLETNCQSLLENQLYWQCQIALSEGLTNTVRHAHQGLPSTTPIDLEVNLFVNQIEMKIWDWGKPFDLKAKLPSLCQQVYQSTEKEEGRGLYLIQQITDELEYPRLDEQRNCLIMRKTLSKTLKA